MSERKHTPGPWSIAPLNETYEVVGDRASKLKEYGLPTKMEMVSVGTNFGQVAAVPMDESSMENARLIAAAPDMANALQGCLNVLTACVKPRDEIDDQQFIDEAKRLALDALAKARGETQ